VNDFEGKIMNGGQIEERSAKMGSSGLSKIVSGGQTGVDRGALDAAIAAGLAHGGWCPQGRRAEDGAIPERYHFRETPSSRYAVRTAWNVCDSDGTLVLILSSTINRQRQKENDWVKALNCFALLVNPGLKAGAIVKSCICQRESSISLAGGTKLTAELACRYGKPCMIVDLDGDADAGAVVEWIEANGVGVLNVAGPRESEAPGIGEKARRFVAEIIDCGRRRTPASS
jgi:hypothetical protein